MLAYWNNCVIFATYFYGMILDKDHLLNMSGTIAVWIDNLTPCLVDNSTGELVETEVIRIRRKSFLVKYNKQTGWYTNWGSIVKDNEVYALVLKGSVDIQGLVAIRHEASYKATYITWMCTAPHNNPQITCSPKYSGVGGH